MPATRRDAGLSGRTTRGVLVLGMIALGLAQGGRAASVQPSNDTGPSILVSRQLLAARHLKVGEVVSLSGDPTGAHPQSFRIAGVYEPVPDPIRVTTERLEVRLHLPDLLSLTAVADDPQSGESVSAINVKLARQDDAAAFARDLTARLPFVGARPSRGADDGGNPFIVLGRFHLAIAILTVMTSAVFLLALMVLLVDERRESVGTLRIIGLTRGRILLQVLVEGAVIAGAGALFGVGLAAVAEGAFNAFFQWRYDTALVFVRITPAIAWRSVAVGLPLGIAASVLASWALVRSRALSLVRR
jgi:putative ABC transport system permease protein